MVLYNKYRPQTFEQLVGHIAIKDSLLASFKQGKLAHAYLFTGPRGIGKTSIARILAKLVNCQSLNSSPLPCNQCDACLSITSGTNMDVIEMDAASNRGIEDIRSLRDNIKLAPTSAKKKVYIIDEVHMLTGEAFNALLKTLEEPPSHVIFILATTDAQKIPQTILSRVQRYDFKLASIEELVEALKNVVAKESIEIDPEALQLIAKKGQGSFRDCIKLLDQLASGNQKIDLKLIEQCLGTSDFGNLIKLLDSIATKNPTQALEILTIQIQTGGSIKDLNSSILDVLRQIMLIQNKLGEKLVKTEVGEEKYKLLENLAKKFETHQLIKTLNSFQQSFEQSRFVTIPSLPLEVAVVGSCLEIIDQSSVITDQRSMSKDQRSEPQPIIPVKVVSTEHNITDEALDDIQKVMDKWGYVLETVRQSNFSLEAIIRSAKIVDITAGVVVFEVPYSFHQRILESPKNQSLLIAILSDILERPVKINTVLGQRPQSMDNIANVEVAADDEIVRIASEIFSADSIN